MWFYSAGHSFHLATDNFSCKVRHHRDFLGPLQQQLAFLVCLVLFYQVVFSCFGKLCKLLGKVVYQKGDLACIYF
jgi:hypothetical protein